MTITQVQLLSLPVADVDRARDFYTDVLGFDVVHDLAMGPEGRWVQVRPRGGATAITFATWFDSMPAGSTQGLVLATDDVDRDVAELTSRGVAFETEVRQQPWGRAATFPDPDGNRITLLAPALAD
jgi:catechol 2,3-dioxygenase-like lactoylglutathione lyase family enzyme